jgi:hypothetical protein
MARRPITLAVAFALAVGTLIVPVASAAGAPTCLVSNGRTGLGSRSLQAGIDTAAPGDTLVVKGTCIGSPIITKSLTIKGVSNKTFGPATLDGGGIGRALTVENGLSATIIGLMITGGVAGYLGGGLLNNGSTVMLDAVTVLGNRSQYDGGGLANAGGTMTITNTLVVSNTTTVFGGGIWNVGSLTLVNSTVNDNVAGAGGGGILGAGDPYYESAGGRLAITDSTVNGNASGQIGGGIFNGDGSFMSLTAASVTDNIAGTIGGGITNGGIGVITGSTVSHNIASASWGWGGGITNYASPTPGSGVLTIARSTVSSNTAGIGGGIGNVWTPAGSGALTISDSTVTGNTATNAGGAIWNETNLTFATPPTTIGGNAAVNLTGGVFNLLLHNGTVMGGCPTVLGQGVPPSTTTTGFVVYNPVNTAGSPSYTDYNGFGC